MLPAAENLEKFPKRFQNYKEFHSRNLNFRYDSTSSTIYEGNQKLPCKHASTAKQNWVSVLPCLTLKSQMLNVPEIYNHHTRKLSGSWTRTVGFSIVIGHLTLLFPIVSKEDKELNKTIIEYDFCSM